MERPTMKRATSSPFLNPPDAAANPNLNVTWMDNKYAGSFYIVALLLVRYAVFLILEKRGDSSEVVGILSQAEGWTLTHALHFVATFGSLHFAKGTSHYNDRGDYIEQTFWEQIDAGKPWTKTRKFMIGVPVVLFLVTMHFCNWDTTHLVINLPIVMLLVGAKLPEAHGVRLFGLNKTEGID